MFYPSFFGSVSQYNPPPAPLSGAPGPPAAGLRDASAMDLGNGAHCGPGAGKQANGASAGPEALLSQEAREAELRLFMERHKLAESFGRHMSLFDPLLYSRGLAGLGPTGQPSASTLMSMPFGAQGPHAPGTGGPHPFLTAGHPLAFALQNRDLDVPTLSMAAAAYHQMQQAVAAANTSATLPLHLRLAEGPGPQPLASSAPRPGLYGHSHLSLPSPYGGQANVLQAIHGQHYSSYSDLLGDMGRGTAGRPTEDKDPSCQPTGQPSMAFEANSRSFSDHLQRLQQQHMQSQQTKCTGPCCVLPPPSSSVHTMPSVALNAHSKVLHSSNHHRLGHMEPNGSASCPCCSPSPSCPSGSSVHRRPLPGLLMPASQLSSSSMMAAGASSKEFKHDYQVSDSKKATSEKQANTITSTASSSSSSSMPTSKSNATTAAKSAQQQQAHHFWNPSFSASSLATAPTTMNHYHHHQQHHPRNNGHSEHDPLKGVVTGGPPPLPAPTLAPASQTAECLETLSVSSSYSPKAQSESSHSSVSGSSGQHGQSPKVTTAPPTPATGDPNCPGVIAKERTLADNKHNNSLSYKVKSESQTGHGPIISGSSEATNAHANYSGFAINVDTNAAKVKSNCSSGQETVASGQLQSHFKTEPNTSSDEPIIVATKSTIGTPGLVVITETEPMQNTTSKSTPDRTGLREGEGDRQSCSAEREEETSKSKSSSATTAPIAVVTASPRERLSASEKTGEDKNQSSEATSKMLAPSQLALSSSSSSSLASSSSSSTSSASKSLTKLKDFKFHGNKCVPSSSSLSSNNSLVSLNAQNGVPLLPLSSGGAPAGPVTSQPVSGPPMTGKKSAKQTRTIEVQCDGPDWIPVVIAQQFRNRLLKNLNKKANQRLAKSQQLEQDNGKSKSKTTSECFTSSSSSSTSAASSSSSFSSSSSSHRKKERERERKEKKNKKSSKRDRSAEEREQEREESLTRTSPERKCAPGYSSGSALLSAKPKPKRHKPLSLPLPSSSSSTTITSCTGSSSPPTSLSSLPSSSSQQRLPVSETSSTASSSSTALNSHDSVSQSPKTTLPSPSSLAHCSSSKEKKDKKDKKASSGTRRRRFRSGLDMIRHPQRKKKAAPSNAQPGTGLVRNSSGSPADDQARQPSHLPGDRASTFGLPESTNGQTTSPLTPSCSPSPCVVKAASSDKKKATVNKGKTPLGGSRPDVKDSGKSESLSECFTSSSSASSPSVASLSQSKKESDKEKKESKNKKANKRERSAEVREEEQEDPSTAPLSASKPKRHKPQFNKALGETLLHRAARQGYHDVVMSCLGNNNGGLVGGDINVRDNAGYTPLHECCMRGHLEIARCLLEHGANVNVSAAGGIRPLHDAVESDHVQVARLLLAYGADPTIATYSGLTPLKLARSNCMKQFLRGLLVDITGNEPEDDGKQSKKAMANNKQRPPLLPWKFSSPSLHIISKDDEPVSGFDVLAGVPTDGDEEDSDHCLLQVSEDASFASYTVYRISSCNIEEIQVK
ncbi:BCL-6 corepressor [Halotydeus destructor]|nr:BCL-6 corepressor [Halotydeus destructor]